MAFSAAPLYMPYFSKYLYNTCTIDSKSNIPKWTGSPSIVASWHISNPTQMMANADDIPFVANPQISLPTLTSQAVYNDYKVTANDYMVSSKYIYPQFWKSEFEDMYDKNGKQVTLYARLDEEPSTAMRKFYYFDGSLWIITKIDNYSVTNTSDWFSKITFIKVTSKYNYLS